MPSLTAKIIDRSVLLAATLALVAKQYSLPSTQFWTNVLNGRGYVLVILVTTIATFGALTPAQTWSERARVAQRAVLRQQVLNHFGRLLAVASRVQPQLAASDLGLHVWRVRWFPGRPWRRLVRIATYRLGSTPATRPFEPGRGVGVVGLCWKRNEEVSVDVAKLAAQMTTEDQYEAYRSEFGGDAVMNLSWKDFVRIRHRGAVFASPIRNGRGDFIGCISVDARDGFDSLLSDDLWHEINSLCLMLANGHMADV